MEVDNDIGERNDHQQQALLEQQQLAVADGANANDDNNEENDDDDVAIAAVLLKLTSLLQQQKEFPFRTRNKIVVLAEEYIEKLGDDIHEMLCDQNNGENYHGLDSERDTEAELETAIQHFPELVSRPDDNGNIPLQCIYFLPDINNNFVCNLKAIPFIAVLVRLGCKFDQFTKEERGGLLVENIEELSGNTSHQLVISSHSSHGEEHNQLVDNTYLTQVIRLRRMCILKKEDVRGQNLVHRLCNDEDYFAERRFQFLVEWDPSSLASSNEDGWLPLHYAAFHSTIGFRTVFEYIIRYFPEKKGISLLFKKSNYGDTPFKIICRKYGRDKVMKIVEDTINNSDIPINTIEALFLAASDEDIHLDCVYHLLRREPDVLVKLLLSRFTNNSNNNDSEDGNEIRRANDGAGAGDVENNTGRKNDNDDGNNNNGTGSDDLSVDATVDVNANVNYRKRKRDS